MHLVLLFDFKQGKESVVRYFQVFLLSIIALTMLGCASPQDKAYNAQAGVHNERLQLVEKYQKCVKDAGSDNVKAEGCDHYLKAAEALK